MTKRCECVIVPGHFQCELEEGHKERHRHTRKKRGTVFIWIVDKNQIGHVMEHPAKVVA